MAAFASRSGVAQRKLALLIAFTAFLGTTAHSQKPPVVDVGAGPTVSD